MITITDPTNIEAAFAKFTPGPDGAHATCRLIDGADSAMDPQEWAEPGTIDGIPATVYFLFTAAEASSEDASNYPWDVAHIAKIEIDTPAE